ncbi:MAG: YajQ family cyclic di-GMP-binding protein [Candidatus Manganitrophus sp.]|nr:YajQ family cyclic di-GMP-binding protein [Candidatus Manganitrophus sp.]WDT72794.1 MAG: YajQ family cyclic di-GMP-binding protein [Candidatus Manganitrophus sp.]WDT74985.1 MAG: YajQ family cyclic di-GMP-binding protein [Candidatus Manganitrophus sp.]WDT79725.1 MAG: YajQ family cyclic di-GMP-binding protein [Candidatus Manganitrophus sp.]
MAETSSFDVVSKIDIQEVKNAVEQTMKEVRQRFDLKGSKSEIRLEEEKELIVTSEDEYKLKAVLDVLQTKLVKRNVSLKALVYEKVEKALGGTVRQKITLQQGIPSEKAKEISKAIRDGKFKVQAQIQADQVRVQSKSKDELQSVINFLKSQDFGLDLQFLNYR